MFEITKNNIPNYWNKYLSYNINNINILDEIEEKIIIYDSKTQEIPIYPNINNIFKAFSYFKPDELKVVIIGQDCYHQKNQATGLCFGVPINMKIPPSLRVIL